MSLMTEQLLVNIGISSKGHIGSDTVETTTVYNNMPGII